MLIIEEKDNKSNLYTLHITGLDGILTKVSLEDDEILIGNKIDNAITLVDEGIDDIHFKLIKNDKSYEIEKVSDKEVLVNGNSIENKQALSTGDMISVSTYQIQYMETTLEEEIESMEDDGDAGKTRFMPVFNIPEAPSKGRLVGISGSVKGKVFEIEKDKISIGRDGSNDIVIDSDGLSRAHSMLEIGDKQITVVDFNSTNGTFVKGKRITTEVIKPGTTIQFANAALRYELDDAEDDEGVETSKKSISPFVMIVVLLVIIGIGAFFYINSMNQTKKEKIQLKELQEKIKAERDISSPNSKLKIAEEALNNSQYEEALKIIKSVLKKHNDHPNALLLQGKVIKAQKKSQIDIYYKKGMKYYKTNEFDRAKEVLLKIPADYSKYDEVKNTLDILKGADKAIDAYNQALNDFNQGNIEKSREGVLYSIKSLPIYHKALELKDLLNEIQNIFSDIKSFEKQGDIQGLIKNLNKIIVLVPNKENFFYKFAKSKLKELKTGKNFKTEMYYAKGIESIALRKYGDAYTFLKKANALNPEIIKIKIAYTETKQKRASLLKNLHDASLLMQSENPLKAKFLLKKIVEMGEEDNLYYQKALKKLEN